MTLDPRADLLALLAAILVALMCGLLGNFLVLRRLSLMGDAISHSVLPGLVLAFIVTQSRDPLAMLVGAAIAGVLTVVLVEVVRRHGRVETGAAMGVVFSVLFALGVLLIEHGARQVDLDADCVLHGDLELSFLWTTPQSWSDLLELRTWVGYTEPAVVDPATGSEVRPAIVRSGVPARFLALLAMCGATILFVTLLFKELRIAAFDPAVATTQGMHAGLLHHLLMVFVAGAAVTSFEAVGSILVIAMLICPAATARLLTDRLASQMLVSAAVAIATAVLGYAAATQVPPLLGGDAVNIAGSMTVVSGALLAAAVVAAPRHGVLARLLRRRGLARRIARDDVLAALYRAEEDGRALVDPAMLSAGVPAAVPLGVEAAARAGLLRREQGRIGLSPRGRRVATAVVRRHRLWEGYLVDEAGLAPDHVHDTAERLEHLDVAPTQDRPTDPHGRSVPPEQG